MSTNIFTFGHVFAKGDLPIYITDLVGNPTSPPLVQFTLFRCDSSNPNPVMVGPENRKPVMSGVGEYYVTGIAGECGQPGDWYVRWQYQESSDGPLVEDIYYFKVISASQFNSCCDTITKKGWD